MADTAEQRLLAEAVHHDAKALKVLGRHVLEVVAPEVAEEHERRLLEDEERRARERTRLTMSEDGHGLVHGRFTIPALHGSMFRKALLGLAAPKHQASHPAAAPLLRADGGPTQPATDGCGVLRVPRALPRQPPAARRRRLACEAGIIPSVLGGAGQVLDVGRRRRFHTEPQRLALALRDGGCTADACDWPPGLCHAHHDVAWSRGGETSVANGRLLCPRHHTLAHDPGYTTTKLGTGKLRFTRTDVTEPREIIVVRSLGNVVATPGRSTLAAWVASGRCVGGVVLALVGLLWILQGLNVVGGSGMSGQAIWAVIGVVIGAMGVFLVIRSLRTPPGRGDR